MEERREMPLAETLRILFVFVLMVCFFGILAAKLWNLQVAKGAEFQRSLAKQSVRSVRLPGFRGRILDRKGQPLADNQPSYCLTLYLEELRKPGRVDRTIDHVSSVLDYLAEVIDRPRQLNRGNIADHLKRRTPLPLTIWKDLDDEAIARFVEKAHLFPGVELTVEPMRIYPAGRTACHLLGYVGRAKNEDVSDEEGTYHYYLPEMAGASGIEKKFDGVLKANAGGRLDIQVDVTGFKFDEISHIEPGRGSDVILSIDADIQTMAERVLGADRGAVVVVDPRNGDVLALASAPSYNPNDFVPSISQKLWNEIQADEGRPLYNRATGGEYAPGSTFKPVTMLAALESGKLKATTRYVCPGYFELGNMRFRCWQGWGHGSIDLQQALKYSCNVYMYLSALASGPEPIQSMARECGFGVRTGISLDFERPGLVPDDQWKRERRRDAWRDGDTCNLSIGQGALLVTPLQLAMYAAALANNGTLWTPRLVLEIKGASGGVDQKIPPSKTRDLNWKPEYIRVVRDGMRDVIQAPDGTGRRSAVSGVQMAGKTGTAEYGRKEENKKMTWMMAFAPFENPRYAVAVLIEDGVSGGATAAPRMREMMTYLFQLERHTIDLHNDAEAVG